MNTYYIKVRINTETASELACNTLKRLMAECGNSLYDIKTPPLSEVKSGFIVSPGPRQYTGEEGPGYLGAELYFTGTGSLTEFFKLLYEHVIDHSNMLLLKRHRAVGLYTTYYYDASDDSPIQVPLSKGDGAEALDAYFTNDFKIGNRTHLGIRKTLEGLHAVL